MPVLPKIQLYSDEPISELMLTNLIRTFKNEFFRANSLEEVLERRQAGLADLSILDLSQLEALPAFNAFDSSAAPTPLWICADQIPQSTALLELGDEFIVRPLSPEYFQYGTHFWLCKNVRFDTLALPSLEQNCGREMVEKILMSFNESLQKALDNTFQQLNTKSIEGTAKASHAIKASAKLVGAESLFWTCRWFEFKKSQGSPISAKMIKQAEFIFLETQTQFQRLASLPIDKILNFEGSF